MSNFTFFNTLINVLHKERSFYMRGDEDSDYKNCSH